MVLDPRTHAYRDDLADIALQGRVHSARFVPGAAGKIITPIANLYGAPDIGTITTQALLGESLSIFETRDGWHWVQLHADGYVGYLAANEADAGESKSSHRITVPIAHVYAQPDIKSQPLELLPMGARVQTAPAKDDIWVALTRGGYMKAMALAPIPDIHFATLAARFIGLPYLWGGRTALGIDCSGLVQLALQMTGQDCPRDSDQQAEALGEILPEGAPMRQGDLVFFKGHVGMMWDEKNLLHANASTMNVAIEPLETVKTRAAVTAIKRIKI